MTDLPIATPVRRRGRARRQRSSPARSGRERTVQGRVLMLRPAILLAWNQLQVRRAVGGADEAGRVALDGGVTETAPRAARRGAGVAEAGFA